MAARYEECDIVIAGGGLVGATLACALHPSGWRVALVEARKTAPIAPGDALDLRVSALSRASQRILEALDVWQGIAPARRQPYRAMHVWDASGAGAIHFDSADLGEPDLGHIVENRAVQAALYARLEHQPGVLLFCPASLAAADAGMRHVTLRLSDGRALRARLLVVADGADSHLRRLFGIATDGAEYGQHGVVAHVRTERGHGETARQRFLPGGPLALLPLPDGRVSIVWSVPSERAAALVRMPDDDFLALLTEASDGVLGRALATSARAAFPLRRLHASAYVRPRVALVGDAAHVVHPLAGQGLNLGLLDAALLAEVLHAAAARGRDPGALEVLRRYERGRKGENLAMLWALDGLHRLFVSEHALVRRLRNAGLAGIDRLLPLKQLLARHALGLTGELPALARGVRLAAVAQDAQRAASR
ncbi:MAG TPA: UbiH/UbiF/VisC/COQ6 family ubiquinone biosynthesis hydroxylase [Gammaproteobacteria bacterium]|nr:UbiH/UbiF/VisC/COQ6 family ubiquinone biosynthesis hydroxylase [Gammaproteobacteria bacterium]